MKKIFFLNLFLIIILGHPVGNSCPPPNTLKEIPTDDYILFYNDNPALIQDFEKMLVEIDKSFQQSNLRMPMLNLLQRQIPLQTIEAHGALFPETETVSLSNTLSEIPSVNQTETHTIPTTQQINIQIRQHRSTLSEMLINTLELLYDNTHENCQP